MKWLRHPHTRTHTANVRCTEPPAYLLGIVAPALWQLIFNRHPCSFLGIHKVLVNCVLKEFSYAFQTMLVPSETESFSLLMKSDYSVIRNTTADFMQHQLWYLNFCLQRQHLLPVSQYFHTHKQNMFALLHFSKSNSYVFCKTYSTVLPQQLSRQVKSIFVYGNSHQMLSHDV